MSELSAAAGKAVKWSAVSQFGLRFGKLATTAILARILVPSEFGLVSMAAVLVEFAMIFRDLGTGSAVIQREENSQRLLSTVFWANIAFGVLITSAIILAAPLVAAFYDEPRLTLILRVLSVAFLFASASVLQQAILERKLAFASLAKYELAAFLVAAMTGITMAVYGFGVWSLVAQTVALHATLCVLLWRSEKWRPSLEFSREDLREIWAYSMNHAGSQMLTFLGRNADYVLIGKFLGAEALGFYTIAYRLVLYPLQSVTFVLARALFPVYARIRDDHARFRSAYTRMVGGIASLTFPIMIGAMALREPLILTLLGEKWLPVVTLLLILAPVGMTQSIGSSAALIYRAKGRADWMFRWFLVSTSLTVAALVFGMRWGIYGVAFACLSINLLLIYPHYLLPFRLIGLTWREFLRPLAAPLLASLVMAATASGVVHFAGNDAGHAARLGIGILTGLLTYGGAYVAMNFQQVQSLLRLVMRRSVA
jgi:PST family polysaccharide transporter